MPANPALIEKLNTPPEDRLAEVEDFVDFIRQRDQDRGLVRAAGAVSAPAFAVVRENPENRTCDAIQGRRGQVLGGHIAPIKYSVPKFPSSP